MIEHKSIKLFGAIPGKEPDWDLIQKELHSLNRESEKHLITECTARRSFEVFQE